MIKGNILKHVEEKWAKRSESDSEWGLLHGRVAAVGAEVETRGSERIVKWISFD